MGGVRCCLWVVSKHFLIKQFTGMPILSLAGVSLSEGEGEQRTDGVETELELKWSSVCELGQFQAIRVVETQSVVKGQTIAVYGVWTLIEIQVHRRLCSKSQAVFEVGTWQSFWSLTLTRSVLRIRVQSLAHLKTGLVSALRLLLPRTLYPSHTESLAAFQTRYVLFCLDLCTCESALQKTN